MLPYCDAVSRRDYTKTMKPIINEAFVASSGDTITDYNDLFCLFMKHNHVCICDRRNNKQQALLYTAQNSSAANSLNMNTYWQAVKLEMLHFIETVFEHRSVVRYSQVQDTVLR